MELEPVSRLLNTFYTILLEDGPAGGNPLLELQGTKENIETYLREVYLAHDLADLDFYLSFVK